MINVIILKLTEICNLNCSYCYMFNSQDKTYTRVPRLMSETVSMQVLLRIREHLDAHPEIRLRIVLHGGEPTLWPSGHFHTFLDKIKEIRTQTGRLTFRLQTNLFEYDDEIVRKVVESGGSIGVSLDGPEQYNDAVRITHGGKGSYQQVTANLKRLESDGLMAHFGGTLTVSNPDIPPQAYLDWIKELPKKRVSVLWPIHYNYDTPPLKSYGAWYAELFRLWVEEDDASIEIRFFKDAIKRMLGHKNHGDSIGNDGLNSLVVNTDGQYERHDYLRYFSDGAIRTGFNVASDSIDSASCDEVINRCSDLRAHLPKECAECRHSDLCGGGFIANRLGGDKLSFERKSVMCEDHKLFFDAVRQYVDQWSAS
jgi:uncharacterized protein